MHMQKIDAPGGGDGIDTVTQWTDDSGGSAQCTVRWQCTLHSTP